MTYSRGPLCPTDPAHGVLVDWPNDRWAYYCPDQAHDGHGDRPQTRAFFTTPEAEHRPTQPAAAERPSTAPPAVSEPVA